MLYLALFLRNMLLWHPVFLQVRLMVRLFAVMLWLFLGAPPAVRAFRPTLACPRRTMTMTMDSPSSTPPPFTVTSSFRFPTVPLHDAVQYIHTPEHLETVLHHASSPDYFRIRRVSQPVRYGGFVTVSLDCLIRSVPHTLAMLSRPDQNSSCTYMCFHDGLRLGEIHFRVRQNNRFPSSQGHILAMETTYFSKSRRVLDSYLKPTLGFITRFENSSGLFLANQDQFKAHANLLWYRRMVLGLPNTPDRWL